jgi:hypothetical protein
MLAGHKLLLLLLNHTRPSRSTPWRTSLPFILRVGRQAKQFSAENKSRWILAAPYILYSIAFEQLVWPSSNTIALFAHRLACPLSRNTLRVSVSASDVQCRSSSPPLGACKLPHTLKQCEIEHLALTSYRRYQPTPESESRSGMWRTGLAH